ncbi:MAG: galactose mutarotase [Clostridia bacterium]|nr:galactose mutarotase [Clostridia bacterium]
MEVKEFGILPDGSKVLQYILKTCDAEVRILNLGGIITDFIYEGRNVVCGFDTLDDYLLDDSYQGALIGRFANRIAGASFSLNGKTYRVGANEGKNSLHGGNVGFNRRLFKTQKAEENTLILSLFSPDGEEGYPGNLTLRVTYSLDGSALTIAYHATSDADTPVSLTNHSYFNLAGLGAPVLDFRATILADHYTAVDAELIPTGERLPVDGTPFDLRSPRRIGDREGGYDTNFILKRTVEETHSPSLAARVEGSGLTLSVYTTQPCIQFYTGCALEGEPCFRGGVRKTRYTAFCLETQAEPNAPNRGEGILRAGETYSHTTVYELAK